MDDFLFGSSRSKNGTEPPLSEAILPSPMAEGNPGTHSQTNRDGRHCSNCWRCCCSGCHRCSRSTRCWSCCCSGNKKIENREVHHTGYDRWNIIMMVQSFFFSHHRSSSTSRDREGYQQEALSHSHSGKRKCIFDWMPFGGKSREQWSSLSPHPGIPFSSYPQALSYSLRQDIRRYPVAMIRFASQRNTYISWVHSLRHWRDSPPISQSRWWHKEFPSWKDDYS